MSAPSPVKPAETPKVKAKASTPFAPALAPADPGYTRLHISPLDSTLLKTVVPASVLPLARNISYHTIETFPDRRYGFVDLPTEAAEKLKKKLNGMTLRGAKMKIDKARAPPEELVPDCGNDAPVKKRKKVVIDIDGTEVGTSSKKRKQDKDVVKGTVLEDGRKVKRGWTVTPEEAKKSALKKSKTKKSDKEKDKKKNKDKEAAYEIRSKYSDKPEALIKTVVPTGKPMPEAKAGSKSRKNRKDGKQSREIVAHEFEHVTKFPTFLRDAPLKPVVKESASVEDSSSSESESSSDEEVEKTVKKVEARVKNRVKKAVAPEDEADTSSSEEDASDEDEDSSDSDSSDDSSDADSDVESKKEDSSVNVSADTHANDKVNVLSTPKVTLTRPDVDPSKLDDRPNTSSSMKSLTIKIPPPVTPARVHPLEALYKKHATGDTEAAPADVPFSFFGSGGGGATDDEESQKEEVKGQSLGLMIQPQNPMTPYTRQDFEERGMRSAAPTPDTAHPSRMRRFFPGEDGEEEDVMEEGEADELASPMAQRGGALASVVEEEEEEEVGEGKEGDSGFQKWFWENRGELNRSWMRRRKTVAKERRMKDNKTRGFKRG